MRERQDREQCPHVKVTSGVAFDAARAFPLRALSFCAVRLSCSYSLATLKIEWRQASRSAAMSDQHGGST